MHLLCVGGIISLPWFSKELKTTCRRTTIFVMSSLYFSFVNQYSLGGGSPFPTVMVPRYKLSLCHTPIKPDLLGFPGISVFACGLCDHVITRFASDTLVKKLKLSCLKHPRPYRLQWLNECGEVKVISFWNFSFLFFPQKFLSV